MPLLNLVQLKQLSAETPHVCDECMHAVRKNYCRQCDEFFEAGHQGGPCRVAHGTLVHEHHRTY